FAATLLEPLLHGALGSAELVELHHLTSSTLTRWPTTRSMPSSAGVFFCTTLLRMPRSPKASSVRTWACMQRMELRIWVIFTVCIDGSLYVPRPLAGGPLRLTEG